MADKPLFILDAKARWRLAYDKQQWIVQRRKGSSRSANRSGIVESGWRAVSFVGGTKTTLRRVLREAGVVLTPEAQARLDALPSDFLDFVTAPESFAEQAEAQAARNRHGGRQRALESGPAQGARAQ